MTTLKIDIRSMGATTHPDDRVILYAPEVRARIGGGLVSTAPLEVELVDGQAIIQNVEPGPLIARFECLGIADTTEKRGIVPDSGVVTLDDVLELKFTWTPPIITAGVQQIIDEMNRAVGTVGTAVDGAMGGLVRSAESAARASAESSAGSEIFANSANVRAASAETKVDNMDARVVGLETLGGLAAGDPVDGQTANLLEQPRTLTRSALDRATDQNLGAQNLAAFGTKFYESPSSGEMVTLAGAPRENATIADALPDVSLVQVQALDSDADLSDSADWYVIQSLIDDCASRLVKDIKIPRGRYYLSRGINLTNLEFGTHIDATGVVLWATKKMPWMIRMAPASGVYWKARQVKISGLELRGNYLAHTGVIISNAQEWHLDVKIHNCYVAVSISDTWYGAFSSSCVIINCLIGVSFDVGNFAEVNTIQIPNLKINFAAAKSNFPDASNTDSIGIRISTILGGIHFDAPVVEGVDYGVKYVPVKTGNGSIGGLATFTAAYWEAIKKRVFDFSEYGQSGYIHTFISLEIRGNRFNVPEAMESVFGPGIHVIENNQKHKVKIMDSPPTRVTMRIDNQVELTQSPTSTQVFIDRSPTVPTSIYTERFSPWGNSNTYPQGEAMLYTMQHAGYRTTPSMEKLRGTAAGSPSKLYPAYSITSRPTVYHPSVGDAPNGPVLHGADGWYMLLLGEGGVLTTRKVNNVQRLDEGTTSRSGKELHHMAPTAQVGSVYRCIDMNAEVVLGTVGGQRRWVDSSGRLRIGTTDELLEAVSSIPNGNRVFDISTGQSAQVRDGSLYLYDWFGDVKERIAGPLASRPAVATPGLVYYDIVSKSYTQFQNGLWEDFTPNPLS